MIHGVHRHTKISRILSHILESATIRSQICVGQGGKFMSVAALYCHYKCAIIVTARKMNARCCAAIDIVLSVSPDSLQNLPAYTDAASVENSV